MLPGYAIAIAIAIGNWYAFFAFERWGRTRLLGLSDRPLRRSDGIGCIVDSMIYPIYLTSLFFGTVLFTLSNLYQFGEVLECLEEHSFLLEIYSASNPIIHVLCDSFTLIRVYRNTRKLEELIETDANLGELWGIAQPDVSVIRARNGGVFPEDLDFYTLREFRIRTSDRTTRDPSPSRRCRVIKPRTLLHYVGTDRFTIRMCFLYAD